MQAAIEARVHYVSIADDFEAARDALALDEAAKQAGVTIITGLGNCPGLTNLLAKKGTQSLERAKRVNISWFGGADDAGGYANYRHAVHIFCGKVPSFQGGREVPVKAGSGREIVEFPAPCGRLPVYHTGHAEPVTIPRNMPELEEVTLKGGIWPNWLARAGILLVRSGNGARRAQSEVLGGPVLSGLAPTATWKVQGLGVSGGRAEKGRPGGPRLVCGSGPHEPNHEHSGGAGRADGGPRRNRRAGSLLAGGGTRPRRHVFAPGAVRRSVERHEA